MDGKVVPLPSATLTTNNGMLLLKKAVSQIERDFELGNQESNAFSASRTFQFFDVEDGLEDSDASCDDSKNSEDRDANLQVMNSGSSHPPPPNSNTTTQKDTIDRIPLKPAPNRGVDKLIVPFDGRSYLSIPSGLIGKHQRSSSMTLIHNQLKDLLQRMDQAEGELCIIVLLLRSGRFAAGVFMGSKCTHHKSFQRYTVRKGQGKAQSAQDGKRKPKSIGSQLRRAGEQSLKDDIESTITEWQEYFGKAFLIFASCPNSMKSSLFLKESILRKGDPRLRSIPFDTGRPSFEAVCAVYDVMLTLQVTSDGEPRRRLHENEPMARGTSETQSKDKMTKPDLEEAFSPLVALSELHEAARDGDLSKLLQLLSEVDEVDVDEACGEDFMTPLHFAAASSSHYGPEIAAACVEALLLQGHANPCKLDARQRLPYFLASNDKVRDAFRLARSKLGEEVWDWENARVGAPLTEAAIEARKQKAAEKKRRKRANQREKRAKEKKPPPDDVSAAFNRATKGEDNSVSTLVTAACDFCHVECKGRRRALMLRRLEYSYCSTECVQKHKRKLLADAAAARFT